MRNLASIQKINEIRPIKGADAIEVVSVLGWECVTKKGEFQVNDLVIYVEIDSILPERPEFEFMRSRRFKVKTVKLRGQISQGICFPLSVLPEGGYKEGQNVTDLMGVVKYDPQSIAEELESKREESKKRGPIEKALMRFKWYRNLVLKKKHDTWPSFIPKTDEIRIQSIGDICERNAGVSFNVTEKIDGQSGTYALKRIYRKIPFMKPKYEFYVCSRNIHLKTPHVCSYWTVAEQLDMKGFLLSRIKDHDFIIVQGEIIGTGIQKNKYNVNGYDFRAFNLIYETGRVSNAELAVSFENSGRKTVPMLYDIQLKDTIHDSVELAKGKSRLTNTHREGIVLRNGNFSFKIINPDFLIRYDE